MQRDEPFLKWPGGKRWIAEAIARLLSAPRGRYFEPFLGAGAVFFALRTSDAVLSDTNRDLIEAFVAVRDHGPALIDGLRVLPVDERTFHLLRSRKPASPLETATRMIYLNRTAFNGLWRVNQLGEFNVPFGCKPGTTPVDSERVARCAEILQGTSLLCSDFRDRLDEPRAGDRVYLDPPYTVMHNNNGFRRYNERIFSWADQCDLAAAATDLSARGCHVVVTNAAHGDVAALYDERLFARCEVNRHSRIAAAAQHRRSAVELLLISRHSLPRQESLISQLATSGIAAMPV